MKKILYIISFFVITLATAQESTPDDTNLVQPIKQSRWFYQGELSFTFPTNDNAIYSYKVYNSSRGYNESRTLTIDEQPIISSDFSVNYQLFKVFSIGTVGGFAHFQNPVTTGFKLGGVLRLNPVKTSQAHIFTQVAGFLPLSSAMEASMGEVKLGFSVPFLVRNRYSMHLAMYTTYTQFDLKERIYSFETPQSMKYRGIGFSFGVRF